MLVCQPICLLDKVAFVKEVIPITTFSLGDTINDSLKELLLIILISYSTTVTQSQGGECAWDKSVADPAQHPLRSSWRYCALLVHLLGVLLGM